tara:strand:- start:60 stop:695 length:636 start_codon:yes stop_codon:yes gene_type:complete
MIKNNIFSPFYYQGYVEETPQIRADYLPKMISNYEHSPNHSHDWQVHTNYTLKDNLPNEIDWWVSVQHYKTYVNQFISHHFRGLELDWRIDGEPWYNVYGKGQKADQHEHMTCDFSAVHFLKFNPEVHEPIRFIHPELSKTKYLSRFKPQIVDNLGTCTRQSYYKEHFVPDIYEGDLIIFPSELQHLVWKNQSDETRVTIAFNFSIREKKN